MADKYKIYAVALMAFSPLADVEGRGPGTLVEASPALIQAASPQELEDKCREYALTRWPKGRGWYDHQAVVTPVTQDFYRTALQAHSMGIADMSDANEMERIIKLK
jgi:hypothetical protein